MTTKYINIQSPYPLQAEIEEDTHRFRVVDCGRRWGKTVMAMREAFNMLVKGYMGTGSKQRGWVVAPTFPLVREDWMTAEDLLKDAITKKQQTDMRMDFGGIGFLEFKSAERGADGLLGAGLNCCVVDEAKLVDKDSWEKGLRPALADKLGRCIFISTPKGRNSFYELYLKEHDDADWKSWKHSSNTNPYFPKKEYESLRYTTPEMIFRQEYEADFLEDEASVFKNISRCLRGGFEDYQLGEYYTIGCDLGRTEDFTVLTVIKNSTCQVVDVHRFNKIDWSLQKEHIKSLCDKYRKVICWIDSTGLGDPIEEDLRKSGIATKDFKFSSSSKQHLVEQLIVAIEQGLIGIPDRFETEFLINELKSFAYEILPSGHLRYSAPQGQHDDGVMSLGLAVLGISHLLYRQRKEKPLVKTGWTADDEEKYYRINVTERKKNPFLNDEQFRDKIFGRRLKRILQT